MKFIVYIINIADYISVPVARPKMNYNPERNATAVYVKWHPVADNRETMKGRVGGYTVGILSNP